MDPADHAKEYNNVVKYLLAQLLALEIHRLNTMEGGDKTMSAGT